MAPADDTLEQILRQVRRLLDCRGCAFLIIDWRRQRIAPAATWFSSEVVRSAMEPVLDRPLDPDRPGITEAAVWQGQPLLVREIESWPGAEGLRDRLEQTLPPGQAQVAWNWYRSSMLISCPVRTATGRSLGVLAIATGAVGPEDLRAVEVFADLAAIALERNELLDHERRIAQALARGFVPRRQDQIEGLELGSLYEPAEQVTGGGDFFGAWPLSEGCTALLLGDVSGKGLEVAATSAMVRFFVEACSVDRDGPAAILAAVNALLLRRGVDGIVPAFLGVVGGGELRWCNAGHFPPYYLPADGELIELAATGIPLAVDRDASWDEHRERFTTGDLLVGTTDGMVDARRDRERYGESRLRASLEARRGTDGPQALADGLFADVSRWASLLADDIAILSARAC